MSKRAMDMGQRQREEARWRILRILDAGRPIGVGEEIILRVLDDLRLGLGPAGVRRELDYLSDLKLAEVGQEDDGSWYAKLTADGVDLVEYTAPAPPGVARPKRYW
ncbi:MAG TPA: hypothetical protein VKS22_02070 [Candidatus Binataceae bacterium]|nr:hypothetical protein [Candidatus Binataceae bacterium]